MLRRLGCLDYRVVAKAQRPRSTTPRSKRASAPIGFQSMTIRAFKLSSLEDICEDYGQVAVYLGTDPSIRMASARRPSPVRDAASRCWCAATRPRWSARRATRDVPPDRRPLAPFWTLRLRRAPAGGDDAPPARRAADCSCSARCDVSAASSTRRGLANDATWRRCQRRLSLLGASTGERAGVWPTPTVAPATARSDQTGSKPPTPAGFAGFTLARSRRIVNVVAGRLSSGGLQVVAGLSLGAELWREWLRSERAGPRRSKRLR